MTDKGPNNETRVEFEARCKVLMSALCEQLDGQDFVLLLTDGMNDQPCVMSSLDIDDIMAALFDVLVQMGLADNLHKAAEHVNMQPGNDTTQ